MLQIPSLPFFPSASLPEVVWLVMSVLGGWVAIQRGSKADNPRVRLKNIVRAVTSGVFAGTAMAAIFAAPAVNPTWLSVLNPLAFAFGAFSMALLSVIDEQAT